MIDNFEMISLSCASRFSWESRSLLQVQIFASITDDIKLLYILYDLHIWRGEEGNRKQKWWQMASFNA